jgi:hypothetical protein
MLIVVEDPLWLAKNRSTSDRKQTTARCLAGMTSARPVHLARGGTSARPARLVGGGIHAWPMRLRERPKHLRACGRSRRQDKKNGSIDGALGRQLRSREGGAGNFSRRPAGGLRPTASGVQKSHRGVRDSPRDDLCVGRRGKERSAS